MVEKIFLESQNNVEIHVHPLQEQKQEKQIYYVTCKKKIKKCILSDGYQSDEFNQIKEKKNQQAIEIKNEIDLNQSFLNGHFKNHDLYKYHSEELFRSESDLDEITFKNIISKNSRLISNYQYVDSQTQNLRGKKNRKLTKMVPFILIFALSFHGFFEGIAIGLQKELSSFVNLVIAVSLHKWVESLTLGIQLQRKGMEYKTGVFIVLMFSIVTPLGIGLGWILQTSSDLISAIFMSISTGSFLYISLSELIVEEFSISKYKFTKFLYYMLGIMTICIIIYFKEQ